MARLLGESAGNYNGIRGANGIIEMDIRMMTGPDIWNKRGARWLAVILIGWGCLWGTSGATQAQEFQDDTFVPAGRFLLRWNLEQGQQLRVEAVQDMTTETFGPLGSSGPVPSQLTIRQDWEVTAKDEKKITILQTFRQIKMSLTVPVGGRIEADTELPPPESVIGQQVHENLKFLVGRQVEMKLSSLGEVVSFKFLPLPEGAAAPKAGAFLTEDSLKNAVGQMVRFPDRTLAPGDTWGTTNSAPQPNGKATVTTEYTFEGPVDGQADIAKVTVAPELKLEVKDDALVVEKQESQGYVLYDLKRRLVRETYLKQLLTISFTGDSPGKRQIDTTVRMTIELVAPE